MVDRHVHSYVKRTLLDGRRLTEDVLEDDWRGGGVAVELGALDGQRRDAVEVLRAAHH